MGETPKPPAQPVTMGETPKPPREASLVFLAAPGDPVARLDKLVVALLARAGRVESRAVVQRWIEHGKVLVDGRPRSASAAVPEGARVEIAPEPPPLTRAE